jgi:glutamyl-tRNA(Gln) amidotransferase subunit E
MNEHDIDYSKLNLKVGLEIHQQLDTHKLFCDCESKLNEKKGIVFLRRLRPTQSEMGEIDRAAVAEAQKKLCFYYQTADTCLVEADEEPPHAANDEAIDITLEASFMSNAKIVDEVHFMRKVVIDGSNTAGFQRTALVALDGFIEVNGKKIGISTICLEEDAARKIEEKKGEVVYRLDRLGIPLIEIATLPQIRSPNEAKEVAEYIGSLLRATKKVKRGIGTIREDVNISIARGARVEIKGVQELKMIPKYIEEEVARQLGLIDVKNELERRGIKNVKTRVMDISSVLKNTRSAIIKNILSKTGRKVIGIRLVGFEALLGSKFCALPKAKKEKEKKSPVKRRLGAEFAQYAKTIGIEGIIHSDEMPAYGITIEEIKDIKKALDIEEGDAFVIAAGEEEMVRNALNAVIERAKQAIYCVPEETRDAQPDGTTTYSRPLPGKERMYPETDIKPIRIDQKRIEKIKLGLPELPERKMKRMVETYKLNEQQAEQLIDENLDIIFEQIVNKYGMAAVISRTLLNTLPELKNEGIDVNKISVDVLDNVFSQLHQKKFAKEAVPELLFYIAKHDADVYKAVKALKIEKLSSEEAERIIDAILKNKKELIKDKGMSALSPLMGIAMKELRGKIDGKIINEILKEKLKKKLS